MCGSQPTYEELKLEEYMELTNESTCSQPTYEELKQLMISAADGLIVVLSLPMRN